MSDLVPHRIGLVIPQAEIGSDVGALREFAQRAEGNNFGYIAVADHVIGADPSVHNHEYLNYYSSRTPVTECLTLLAFVAAMTDRIGLATSVLVLPQRQTALVAKQAAQLDLLSGGRLRLGVGVGWNQVEFEALGASTYRFRGRHLEEQIDVLRALWTQDLVTFHGEGHDLDAVAIFPPPLQRPIPIWIGVGGPGVRQFTDPVLRRIGRQADGWCPNLPAEEWVSEIVDRVRNHAIDAGRDPASIGFEGRVNVSITNEDEWEPLIRMWKGLGVTHLLVDTRDHRAPDGIRRLPLEFPDAHLERAARFHHLATS
jgi:probable F420-dependent oxidoreductase